VQCIAVVVGGRKRLWMQSDAWMHESCSPTQDAPQRHGSPVWTTLQPHPMGCEQRVILALACKGPSLLVHILRSRAAHCCSAHCVGACSSVHYFTDCGQLTIRRVHHTCMHRQIIILWTRHGSRVAVRAQRSCWLAHVYPTRSIPCTPMHRMHERCE